MSQIDEEKFRAIDKYIDNLDKPSRFKCWACGKRLIHYDLDLGDLVQCCAKHGFKKVCQDCFYSIEDEELKELKCFHRRFKVVGV